MFHLPHISRHHQTLSKICLFFHEEPSLVKKTSVFDDSNLNSDLLPQDTLLLTFFLETADPFILHQQDNFLQHWLLIRGIDFHETWWYPNPRRPNQKSTMVCCHSSLVEDGVPCYCRTGCSSGRSALWPLMIVGYSGVNQPVCLNSSSNNQLISMAIHWMKLQDSCPAVIISALVCFGALISRYHSVQSGSFSLCWISGALNRSYFPLWLTRSSQSWFFIVRSSYASISSAVPVSYPVIVWIIVICYRCSQF